MPRPPMPAPRLAVSLLAVLLLTVGCLGTVSEDTDPGGTAGPTTLEDPGRDAADDQGTGEHGEGSAATSTEPPADGSPVTTARSNDCLARLGGLDLHHVTLAQLQAAMQAGQLTSEDLVQAYLERFQAYDEAGPGLNAIQTMAPDALEQARALDAEREAQGPRGPLHGIPVLLKDNIGTTDMPTTAGSIALAENVPPEQATITAKLRDAGAIVLGKAQLSEFANWVSLRMPNGYSSLGGQVINAYTLQDPSGSSSGSGVAASMALAAGTVGTETSGSILSPSNANSVVGVKPTLGLTSRAGIIPLAHNFDVPGPMTRNVYDAAAMLSAMAGPDPADPPTAASEDHLPTGGDYTALLSTRALAGVRLGYDQDHDGELWNRTLDELEALGADLVPIDPGEEHFVSITEIGLIPNEFKYGINRYLAEQAGDGLPVETLTDIILYNQQRPDEVKYGQDLLIASDASPGSREIADPAALPTITASQAIADGLFEDNDLDALIGPNAPYTSLGAAAGYPTVTLPMGYEDNDPVGLSFFGPAWSEARLLAYAFAYEQATHNRLPPTEVNPALLDGVCNQQEPVEVTWPEGEASAPAPEQRPLAARP